MKYAFVVSGNNVDGSYAGDSALVVVNVSAPASLAKAGYVQTSGGTDYLNGAAGVAIKGKYAFICGPGYGKLVVVDIANPASPSVVTSIDVPNDPVQANRSPWQIAIKGNYAFITTNWRNQVVSVEISDPTNPKVSDVITNASWYRTRGIIISGNYAFVAIGQGIGVIDITDPTNLVDYGLLYDIINILENCDIDVRGNYAYIGDFNFGSGSNAFHIIDISNPAAPSLVSSLSLSNNVVGVRKSGNYVFCCGYGDSILHVVDVSDPNSPSEIASLDIDIETGGVLYALNQIIISGTVAYISGFNGLATLDISDPQNPVLLSVIGDSGSPNYLDKAYGLALTPEAGIKGSPLVDERIFRRVGGLE